METLKAGRALSNAFQLLKDHDDQLRLIHPAKLSTIIERERKTSHNINSLKYFILGWWDGSAIKNTGCSCRAPEFNSQEPHYDLQPSIKRSDALFWHAGIWVDRTPTYKQKKKKQKKHKRQIISNKVKLKFIYNKWTWLHIVYFILYIHIIYKTCLFKKIRQWNHLLLMNCY